MNEKYENEICPVCYAKFFDDDDIVVCPICGAPHHRDCYKRIGHCGFEANHYTPLQWDRQHDKSNNSDHAEGRSDSNDRVGVTCPNCGAISGSDTLFCPNCGTPFGQNRTDYRPDLGGTPTGGGYAPAFSDPLGGVSAQETIDDVPIVEVSSFIGPNSSTYCPRFVRLKKGSGHKVAWSWSAFLIPEYFFFYRKCYAAAVSALCSKVASAILMTPLMNFMYSDTSVGYGAAASYIAADIPLSTMLLGTAGYLLMAATMLIFGLFGNYFYKKHCIDRIKAIKTECDAEDYHERLAKSGGINIWGPLLGFAIYYLVVNIVSIYIF